MRHLFFWLPTRAISNLVGFLAYLKIPKPFSTLSVRIFSKLYAIDVASASKRIEEYRSIGDFFVRDLRPGVRPIESGLVSPVDGTLRGFGGISAGELEQIKGVRYSLSTFLLNDDLSRRYEQGVYLNFYLAPSDYHHVHSPVKGNIRSVQHITGSLLPVNDYLAGKIPGIFTRNERISITLETEIGLVTVVMVGALNVGHMVLSFESLVATKRYDPPLAIKKGARLGTFFMGSTVVVLVESNKIKIDDVLSSKIGSKVAYGERLGAQLSLRDHA